MHSISSNPKQKPSFQFEAIGTHWSIETNVVLAKDTRRLIADRIELFDRTYSRFRDDSLVMAMTTSAGMYQFPDDAVELMTFYRELYDFTDGLVTPLVGSQLVEAGYDKQYSFQTGKISTVLEWDEAMTWDGSKVTTTVPITLDVGAAGKGYLVDIIGQLLEEQGVGEYVIDASGDVRCRGGIERIGLENPNDTSRVIGVMNVENASLCASAANRRRWARGMHHIFHPYSGSPASDVVATWVVHQSTMIADGLATALFFMDGSQLQEKWKFQYVRLMRDGKLSHSHEFVGELFI